MDIKLKNELYGMIADCKGKVNELNDTIQKLEDYIINMEG